MNQELRVNLAGCFLGLEVESVLWELPAQCLQALKECLSQIPVQCGATIWIKIHQLRMVEGFNELHLEEDVGGS